MKKKILILAYDFPPYVSVGGLRPFNWYKYSHEFNVEPIVITRQWANKHGNKLDYVSAGWTDEVVVEKNEIGTILRTPYRPNLSNRLLLTYGENRFVYLRKFITVYYEMMQFVMPIGPKAELYRAAKSYLLKNKVDVIIATGDPFVLFSFASKLSKEFHIPWIADYRDPWSHNQERSKLSLRSFWNRYLEKKIVVTASHITTVSKFVHRKIDALVPNKPFTILTNGYDPEPIEAVQGITQSSDELTIGFVGTIYNWHPIEGFLKAVELFIKEHSEVKLRLNFYGTNLQSELQFLVKEKYPGLNSRCSIFPRLPNAEVLQRLATNNVVLLFNYYSYMGTKIFDYLGLKRKILFCYSNDPEANELKEKYYRIIESDSDSKQLQVDLIEITQSGTIVKDANHLQVVLWELWKEFESTKQIQCSSVGVEKYSRKLQVKELAEIIQGISAKSTD